MNENEIGRIFQETTTGDFSSKTGTENTIQELRLWCLKKNKNVPTMIKKENVN